MPKPNSEELVVDAFGGAVREDDYAYFLGCGSVGFGIENGSKNNCKSKSYVPFTTVVYV